MFSKLGSNSSIFKTLTPPVQNCFLHSLGWRVRRILFRGKRRRVRAWRRQWTVKYRRRRYRIRRLGGQSRVYFKRGWRPLKRRRGNLYLKYGRSWLRIRRYGRKIRVIYRRRRWPVSKYQVRFRRKWTSVIRRGRRVYLRFRKRLIPVRRRRVYFMRYGGRKLLVKRKGRRYRIRFRRKWLRSKRVRYGRKHRLRGKEIITDLAESGIVICSKEVSCTIMIGDVSVKIERNISLL